MISLASYLSFFCVCLLWAVESYQLQCPTNIPDNTTLYVPDPKNCSNYYECRPDGSEDLCTCPDNLNFNPTTDNCDWPENVRCNDDPKCPDHLDPDQDILLPNRHNCSTYIQCTVNGSPIIKSCPAGLNFNEQKQQCDYPEEANCHETVYLQVIDNDEDNTEVDNNNIDDYEVFESDEKEANNGSVEEIKEYNYCSNIECPKEESTFYLTEGQECNEFCKCAHGVAFKLDCPSGLVFNPNINSCDWPENYKCISEG